jgi:hypothetical protein
MHFKIDKEIKSSYADKISMFAPVWVVNDIYIVKY